MYEILLSAEFYRFKIGHPDMQRYRQWVDGMFGMIQKEYDFSKQWERQKERYLLLGRAGKGKGDSDLPEA